MEFAKISVVCEGCYFKMKALNLNPSYSNTSMDTIKLGDSIPL